MACVFAAGLLSGLALFGWHPFHLIDAPSLTTGDAVARTATATGYTLLCMLSIAAIAFALGLLLPRGAEALGATIAFVVAASILNAQSALRRVVVLLPVHYWQDWTALFTPGGTTTLDTGVLAQLATITVATSISVMVLSRRDPAA